IKGQTFDTEGFVTRDLLQKLLPLNDYDVYLCGPGPFMQAMFETLLSLGIPETRISYEFFGPASLLKPVDCKTVSSAPEQIRIIPDMNDQLTVSFAKSGLDTIWDPEFDNLLEFAEEHGVMADFSCRAGTCDSCKTLLESGKIEYSIEPMERPPEGSVLICCAKPSGNIVLDL
ncbi:MAG: 2Fe-2S iron-sulfur cluster binding domain-containing protein, partial [Cohaesibacteraceae bacterium]|nr:2Fe-2S iron-sulfur cluster binding domain-containing protein [Cohaesibacteraceae bacterium]